MATETRLDSDITKPSTTAPGDGPADTTDPTEHASSRRPQPGEAALAAGTVNAVVSIPAPVQPTRDTSKDRFEEYDTTAPDGSTVRMRHNLDSGRTEVITGAGA
jgi:hypothetical protein